MSNNGELKTNKFTKFSVSNDKEFWKRVEGKKSQNLEKEDWWLVPLGIFVGIVWVYGLWSLVKFLI